MNKSRYEGLNAQRDHELIVRRMLINTWTFDVVRATEMALLKTFAVPSIAAILVHSKEFLSRSQKRYDDTDLLLALFIENGYSSKEGMQALQRINRMHAKHPISNEQMLYVLATFVVEPVLWITTFNTRALEPVELESSFLFWIQVGKRMGIRNLFPDWPAMLAYHERYEAEHMVYSEDNALLYRSMLPVVARMMPWPLGKVLASVLPFVMSPRLCRAFGVPVGGHFGRYCLRRLLRVHSRLNRLMPSRPHYRTRMPRPTYPAGYHVSDLGVIPHRNDHKS